MDLAAACLTLTALFAYLNHRFVRLPTAIGVMAIALLLSLGLVALDALGLDAGLRDREEALIRAVDFSDVLMNGMLSLLLFAGALHIDLRALVAHRWQVGVLAVIGTLLSSVIVGFALWWVLPWTGVALPLGPCLLFGALISPTDPIAVISIIKTADAPSRTPPRHTASAGAPHAATGCETQRAAADDAGPGCADREGTMQRFPELSLVIAGESLFNDGVGVVLFTVLTGALATGATPAAGTAVALLLREAGGGLVFGGVVGWTVSRLLRSIDQYQVEVLMTLAAVIGGYALANHLHVSGPLAMVVCGLMLGNSGPASDAMSDETRRHVDLFWELIDEILNAVLFVLLGLEALLIPFSTGLLAAGAAAIAVTLAARWATVALPLAAFGTRFGLPPGSTGVLTWGGLRGGISVALALSLPLTPVRDTVLALTYAVVVFSVLVQGLTIGPVMRHALPHRASPSTRPGGPAAPSG